MKKVKVKLHFLYKPGTKPVKLIKEIPDWDFKIK